MSSPTSDRSLASPASPGGRSVDALGDASQVPAPIIVVKQPRSLLAGGFRHTCAVQADGSLTCFGTSGRGQCDVPSGLGPITAVAAGNFHTCAVGADGSVVCFGDNSFGQCTVPEGLGPVTDVAAGFCHTCTLDANGKVVCFGDDSFGQCSVPEDLAPVRAISAGFKHTCALLDDGSLACFGDNSCEQCEVPEDIEPLRAMAAGDFHTCAVQTDGKLLCFGCNEDGQCDVPSDLGPVLAAAAGAKHTFVALLDGTLWSFGAKGHGQCDVPEQLKAHVYVPPLPTADEKFGDALKAMGYDDRYMREGLEEEDDDEFERQESSEGSRAVSKRSSVNSKASISKSKKRARASTEDSMSDRVTSKSMMSDTSSLRGDSFDVPNAPQSRKRSPQAKRSQLLSESSIGGESSIAESVASSPKSIPEERGTKKGSQKEKSGKKKSQKSEGSEILGTDASLTEGQDRSEEPIVKEPLVEVEPPFAALAAGSFHCCALLPDRRLVIFGDDTAGQCTLPEGSIACWNAEKSAAAAALSSLEQPPAEADCPESPKHAIEPL